MANVHVGKMCDISSLKRRWLDFTNCNMSTHHQNPPPHPTNIYDTNQINNNYSDTYICND